MSDISKFIRLLGAYRPVLSHQQIATLKGQALRGDVTGAKKGLKTILARKQIIVSL